MEGDGSRGARRKGEGWKATKREKYSRRVSARERHGQPKLNEPTRDPKLANFLKTQRRLVLPTAIDDDRRTTDDLLAIRCLLHLRRGRSFSLPSPLFVVPLQRIAANQRKKFNSFGQRVPTIVRDRCDFLHTTLAGPSYRSKIKFRRERIQSTMDGRTFLHVQWKCSICLPFRNNRGNRTLISFGAHFSSFKVEIFNRYSTTDRITYYLEGRSTENIKYLEARTLRNDETIALNFREKSIVGYRGVVSTWIVAEKDRCRRGWGAINER